MVAAGMADVKPARLVSRVGGKNAAGVNLNQCNTRKEIADFICRGFRGVGPVYRVALNTGGVQLPDRSRSGIGRVRGAHQFAKP